MAGIANLRQKVSQGGRIHLYEGGPSDKAGFGFGNFGVQGRSAPDSLGRPGGGNKPANVGPKVTPKQDTAEFLDNLLGPSPNLPKAEEVQRDRFQREDKKTTNDFFKALFNPDLKFKFDPVADYVNRVYGRLNPVQKARILQKVGFTGDFEDFLDKFGQQLYDADNIQFSDFSKGIQNLSFQKPTIPSTIGGIYDAVVGGALLEYTNPFVSFMTQAASPLGMFTSLAFREGDFQMDEAGNIVGDIANLQNAPQDYLDAVAAYNVGASLPTSLNLDQTGLNFTADQVAQIARGEQQRAEERAATRGPSEVYIPPSTSTTSGVAAAGTGATQGSVDYQGIYNNFSPDQKATADKIMAMDEYDLPYAVDYVRMGGPLF